jgi:shikimate dehydrogenase
VVALLDAGASEVRLLNRTAERARALADDLGGSVHAVDWAARAAALDGAALLVNTTSLGMRGQPPLDLMLDALPHKALVTDVVYTPLMTPLLALAQARGNPVVDGLGMLLHQARPGFRAWFGVEPEVDDDLRAVVTAGLSAKG